MAVTFYLTKKRAARLALALTLTTTVLAGCSHLSAQEKQFPTGTVAYMSYSNGDYSLYLAKPKTLETIDSIKLGEGFGFSISEDPQGRIWAPLSYRSDSTTLENHVTVYDPIKDKKWRVEVGGDPERVFFAKNKAYVLCGENGVDPSLYVVDEALEGHKLETFTGAGYLVDPQFDGETFYWYTRPDGEGNNPADMPLQVETYSLSEQKRGTLTLHDEKVEPGARLYGLLVHQGRLYASYESREGNLHKFDAKTGEKLRTLDLQGHRGSLALVRDDLIAVTDVRSHHQMAGTVDLFQLSTDDITGDITGRVVGGFGFQRPVDRVSFVGDYLYAVDNGENKFLAISLDGEDVQEMDAPTMVSNFIAYN
ncbi:MAG TPA: hypothetical protein VFV52_04935 [Bacilli bacterium]|nr:hypothetical protein [Bacilli bacterium]